MAEQADKTYTEIIHEALDLAPEHQILPLEQRVNLLSEMLSVVVPDPECRAAMMFELGIEMSLRSPEWAQAFHRYRKDDFSAFEHAADGLDAAMTVAFRIMAIDSERDGDDNC